jgi:hypothetical protein
VLLRDAVAQSAIVAIVYTRHALAAHSRAIVLVRPCSGGQHFPSLFTIYRL